MVNARNMGAGAILFIAMIAAAEAKLYKWVDEHGVTHYGETIPPEYADKDNVQFSDKGSVIKKTEKVSAEERRANAELAAKKRDADKAAIELKRRDNMLLNTFSNENEIDLARDRNLQQVDSVINSIQLLHKSAVQSLESYRQEMAERTQTGKKIPESLQVDITDTENLIKKLQQDLSKALEKSAAVRASYEADKVRYRELTGGNTAKK